MNKTQKLQKVTEAIHKACPDLLELKFGCEIRNKDLKYHAHIIHSEDTGGLQACRLTGDVLSGNIEGFFEILGQPINLPEVLRAVKDKMGSYDFEIIETFRTTFLEKLLKDWNFLKTLDQQEEPVISLLYSIFYLNA